MVPGEDLEDLQPPVGLLLAGALHEVNALRCGDGHAVGVTRHLVRARHLHHLVHIDAGLKQTSLHTLQHNIGKFCFGILAFFYFMDFITHLEIQLFFFIVFVFYVFIYGYRMYGI